MSTPRLSTPGPINVPRWTENDADRDVAINNINQLLAQARPTQDTSPTALSLPRLGLRRREDWLGQSAPAAPTPAPGGAGNAGGQAVAVKGGGISAYGYKGATGVAGTKGSAPYGFQPEMWDALQKANAAMKAAGLGTFKITDGWRSYEAQVDVKRRKPKLAATPGRSIHGLGLAADISASRAQKEWLAKNGPRYGIYAPIFNKEDWHFQLMPSLYTRGWGR